MITEDYKRIEMNPKKLEVLKSRFASFFDPVNPSSVMIHVKPELFFDVQKSFRGSALDPNMGNMQKMKQAPEAEEVQLQYYAFDDNGSQRLYAFSTAMPTPKDAVGVKYEFEFGSGNTRRIGHNTMLVPRQDDELLYFLYFYSNLFTNNSESIEKNGNEKYLFFVQEIHQKSIKSGKIKEARIITEVNGYDNEQLKKILLGLFLPAAKDENTNFNTLVEYLLKATEDQVNIYESVKKSVKTGQVISDYAKKTTVPKFSVKEEVEVEDIDVDVAEDDEENDDFSDLSIAEYIQEWIDQGKLLLVTEPDAEFSKKGWYQKPAKDDPASIENKFLKTPLPIKIVDGVTDHRITLAEHLAVHTELFNKLKKRW